MANVKITDLAAYTNPDSADVLPIVDVGAAPTGVTKKVSIADLLKNASAGTVAAPGIAFDGDSNTGIYRPDEDQLAISTAGSQALLIDASGNVTAAGTSTADSFIPTSNSVPTNGMYLPAVNNVAISTSGTGKLFIDASGKVGVGIAEPEQLLHLGGNNGIRFGNTGATAKGDIAYTSAGDEFLDIKIQGTTTGFGNIRFYTGPTPDERAQIDSSGTFRVRGNTSNTPGTNDAVQLNGSAPANSLLLDASGRLLVGTSTAFTSAEAGAALVQIKGASGSAMGRLSIARDEAATSITSGEEIAGVYFTDNAGNQFSKILCYADASAGSGDYPGRLVFSTNGGSPATGPTERMRITKQGVVKISKDGTYLSEPSGVHEIRTNLDNNNTLIISSSASNGTQYGLSIRLADDQNDTTRDFLECRGGATVRAQIRSNGGLANYQSNNVDLSDERTKRDITSASSTWSCVQAWEVVNYNYLDDPADDTPRVGVIAQQVQQHCPEVVIPYQEAEDAVLDSDGNVATPAKEERLGVREQQMMWMAIKALQEAQTRIESLEAEVAALKGA